MAGAGSGRSIACRTGLNLTADRQSDHDRDGTDRTGDHRLVAVEDQLALARFQFEECNDEIFGW